MSGVSLKGAECALQDAVLSYLKANVEIKEIFGQVPRIFDDFGGAKPAFPFMVIARHELRPANALDVKIQDHIVDLQVMSRWGGRVAAKEATGLVQRVLDDALFDLEDHKLIWCYIAYSDVLMLRDLNTFKGVVRIKARTTPLNVSH